MVVPGLDGGPAKGYEDQAGEDLETGGQQEDGLPRRQRLLKIILNKCMPLKNILIKLRIRKLKKKNYMKKKKNLDDQN